MPERFYLPADLSRPQLALTGQEAHHLARVLRLGPGQTVTLFDGQGREVSATIESVSRHEVRLSPGPVRRPPPPFPVGLAVSPPKGDRFRWLVEKATELGVSRLVPLLCERTIVEPGAGKLEKLRQTIIAACKQSGRCELMELAEPTPFPDFWDAWNPNSPASESPLSPRPILLQPGHESIVHTLGRRARPPITLTIGPEGGFTQDEIDQARRAQADFASLGRTTLRTETAAIATAAVCASVFADRGLKMEDGG